MTIEIPRFSLADGVSILLCLLCALILELAIARHSGATTGAGIASGCGLLAWLWQATLRAPRALRSVSLCADEGWRLEYRDGCIVAAAPGPGTRVLGRSVVLDWRVRGRRTTLWLTRLDLADGHLRAIRARLYAGAGLRAA